MTEEVPKARFVDPNSRVRGEERARVALAAERKKGSGGECILKEGREGGDQGKI